MSAGRRRIPTLILVILAAVLIVGVTTAFAMAQDSGYTLNWWTADGGGGQSSGSGYTLAGTAGQPDAGTLSGGGYTLNGGFWTGGSPFDVYIPVVLK